MSSGSSGHIPFSAVHDQPLRDWRYGCLKPELLIIFFPFKIWEFQMTSNDQILVSQ